MLLALERIEQEEELTHEVALDALFISIFSKLSEADVCSLSATGGSPLEFGPGGDRLPRSTQGLEAGH